MAFDATSNKAISVVSLGLSIFGSLPVASSAFTNDGAAMVCGKYAYALEAPVVLEGNEIIRFQGRIVRNYGMDSIILRTHKKVSNVCRNFLVEVEQ
jgi:hypothetical protein